MLLTVCTISQLPQALTLGESFLRHHPQRAFLIGLADDPANLPPGWVSPHPLLTLPDTGLIAAEVADRSARYTPTEFVASCKPAFVRAAWQRAVSSTTGLLYAAPSAYVYQSLDALYDQLARATVLLNPHWLRPPADGFLPDEKHLQNVGLYSSGLLGVGPLPATAHFLDWWPSRTATRAHLDLCAGQCLDQLWLMHAPVLFSGVNILKNPGLQVALWNLPQRLLSQTDTGWLVTADGETSPLLTADFTGLATQPEGLFQQQNRLQVRSRADVRALLAHYRAACRAHQQPGLARQTPAYGQQPEPSVLNGWRLSVAQRLQQLSHWIATVPVKPLHR